MIAALLLAAAPVGVIEAERAFAAAAKREGQWTAFREFAAPDATMFVPQPVKAQEWLKDRADPSRPIDWWPTAAWVSCDGTLAVDTGGWRRPDGSVGYFTTVWRRQADGGWKWIVDHGGDLTAARARPQNVRVIGASCNRSGFDNLISPSAPGTQADEGRSPDETLRWFWKVRPTGARIVEAYMWVDNRQVWLVRDSVPAPK